MTEGDNGGNQQPENITNPEEFLNRRRDEDILKRQDEEFWPEDLTPTQRQRLRKLRKGFLRQPPTDHPHKRKPRRKPNISQFPKKRDEPPKPPKKG